MTFDELDPIVEPRTLLGHAKRFSLFRRAESVSNIPGNIAEVGVYKGGSAKLLAHATPLKTVHLFDTFEGMPDRVDKFYDAHRAGQFADTSLQSVKDYLRDCPNVVFHKGVFPESAETFGPVTSERPFSLVHLDADLYRSTLAGIEFFWPRLSVGGFIIFDDYRWRDCDGVMIAIKQFFADKQGSVKTWQDAEFQLIAVKRN